MEEFADEPGIKLFAFHGKLNEEMEGREGGTFSKDITKPKNGRWTFVDKTTEVKPGDTLYFWIYVQHDDGVTNLGYAFDGSHIITGSVDGIMQNPTVLIRVSQI